MHDRKTTCFKGQSGVTPGRVWVTVGALVMLAGALLGVGIMPSLAAPEPRVEICHRPPGNPGNYQTIIISASALSAHLAHGDYTGPCQTPNECTAVCDDHSLCTADAGTWNATTYRCDCTHTPVDCNDGNACTADDCDPTKGCVYTPAGSDTPCDDGQTCTMSDKCNGQGSCRGTPIVGCCLTDADCRDANQCTLEICSAATHTCGPAEEVSCTSSDPCYVSTCNPQDGACETASINCNDSNACTTDSCNGGECIHENISDCECTEGEMRCNGDQKFDTCNFGNWVTRECGPGTYCQVNAGVLTCGFRP